MFRRQFFQFAFTAPFVAAMLAAPSSPALAAGKSGSFSGIGKYKVSGGVQVTTDGGQTTVRLSSNFRSQSGPDLYIYVGNGSPAKRIAKLKKFKGSQSYTFRGTQDISSVHVYCKRYSVGFGTALLK